MLLRAAVRRCGVGDWKSATGGERERSVPRSPIRAKGSSIAAAAKDRKRGKMNDATRARGGRRTACGCAPRCTWRRSGAGTATPPSPSSSCPSTRRTACHGARARASSLRLGATCNGQCDLDGGKTRAPARRPRRVFSRVEEAVCVAIDWKFQRRRRSVGTDDSLSNVCLSRLCIVCQASITIETITTNARS